MRGFMFFALGLRWGSRILCRLRDHGLFEGISVNLTLISFLNLPMVALAVAAVVLRCPFTLFSFSGS